jgi:hypothetical protein
MLSLQDDSACLMLQLDHLGNPVGLLGVVEGDALAFQMWDSRVLKQEPMMMMMASS